MQAGECATIEMSAQDAFGPHNDDNVQVFDTDQFPVEDTLEVGMVLSFADAAGGEVPGVVIAFDDEKVRVDFNHPLAGKDLLFEVRIHQVEPGVTH